MKCTPSKLGDRCCKNAVVLFNENSVCRSEHVYACLEIWTNYCSSNFRELRPQHRRLAEITEMIHTASLMHDDVLDESDTRRGMYFELAVFLCTAGLTGVRR